MAIWIHHIPITEHYRELDGLAERGQLIEACKKIEATLTEHRAFLRYEEFDEDAIQEYTDIADDFYSHQGCFESAATSPDLFDEALNRLYDWADDHRVAIV